LSTSKYILAVISYRTATQLWRFEGTPIPGVFYIKSSATGLYLTVPDNAEQRSEPTLEKRGSGFQPQQLWKFITANGDSDLLIQNYSIDSGLGLDARAAAEPGTIVHLWTSQTTNDSQKFYIQYHK